MIDLAGDAQAWHLHWHVVDHLSLQWGLCTNPPPTKAIRHGCTCRHREDWFRLGSPMVNPSANPSYGIMVFLHGKFNIVGRMCINNFLGYFETPYLQIECNVLKLFLGPEMSHMFRACLGATGKCWRDGCPIQHLASQPKRRSIGGSSAFQEGVRSG